jgi:hypothetical protein
MILPLRRRHRRMFAVIGILLPMTFVAGIAARKPIPTTGLSDAFSNSETFSVNHWDRSDLFTNIAIRVQLLHRGLNTNQIAIQMSASNGFVKADLLIYWLPAESTLKETIPDDAVLLGAFVSGQLLPVPPPLAEKSGRLILYGLADHEVVGVSKPFALL